MLFLITHWKAIVFGIMIVGSFGAGWKFNSALEAEARANLAAEYELELDKEEERRALISMEYEEKLKTQKRKVKVIYKTVEKEVEKTEIENLNINLETCVSQYLELEEEHGAEEAALYEVSKKADAVANLDEFSSY